MRRLAAALTLAALPGAADAHAFTSGANLYAQFVEGAGVVLATPAILLALVPLGLLIGLNGRAGMAGAWPGMLAGLVLGWIVAPSVGPGVVPAAVGVGAVLGVFGALVPDLRAPVPAALAALAVAVAVGVALEGHARFELPVLILAGIAFGVHLVVVLPAALVSGSAERWHRAWLRVGWRVAASWAGAIGLIYGAFLWSGQSA